VRGRCQGCLMYDKMYEGDVRVMRDDGRVVGG
jgi:hypothetical protein